MRLLLRLNLFAPNIVEAILDGRKTARLQMDMWLKPFPVDWERQRATCNLTNMTPESK